MPSAPPSSRRIVVGITGASGAPYALRTVELLAAAGAEVHLAVSKMGRRILADEADVTGLDADELTGGRGDRLTIHAGSDLGAAIASGSFLHDGMIIVPCSSNTLAALAGGLTSTLVQRAAMVTLKERRRLVLGYREAPLTAADLRNMTFLTEAGAIVAPLCPGFYMRPRTVDDLVDFVAGRLLDLVGVPHDLHIRWDGAAPSR